MELAIRVLAVVLGIVAAVAVYPYFNAYVIALIALVGAIAVGVLAGLLVERGLNYVFNRNSRLR